MNSKFFSLLFLLIATAGNEAFAQWITYTEANSPIPASVNVTQVCNDPDNGKVFVFTYDNQFDYHFYEYSNNQWVSHPEHDQVFDTVVTILNINARNGILWVLSHTGIKKYENGTWSQTGFPAGFRIDPFGSYLKGFYIDKSNTLWFPGGPGGYGFTRYNQQDGFTSYTKTTYPAFKQDYGITDMKIDETDSVLWISTNCVGGESGVYSLNLRTNIMTQYDNMGAQYGCVHSVAPSVNQVFVGNCNSSSIRILEKTGSYTQSLSHQKSGCVTDMQVSPVDSSRVWVLSDSRLIHFRDTMTYYTYDTVNTMMKGYNNAFDIQQLQPDSVKLWIATTKGLYSFAYKAAPVSSIPGNDMNALSVDVYPNPGTGNYTLRFPTREQAYVAVYDLSGKQISHELTPQNTDEYQLDIKDAPSGIYFMTVSTGSYSLSKKIIRIP